MDNILLGLLGFAALGAIFCTLFYLMSRTVISAFSTFTNLQLIIFDHLQTNANVGGQPAHVAMKQFDADLERARLMTQLDREARAELTRNKVNGLSEAQQLAHRVANEKDPKKKARMLDYLRKSAHN